MTPDKKLHVSQCVKRVSDLQIRKYIAGQKEHGGKMWKKTGLLHASLEEIADLANYLPTVEQQLLKAIKFIKAGKIQKGLVILEGLLSKEVVPFKAVDK
jgi:hypothetical protein